jgi:hypothetical protein
MAHDTHTPTWGVVSYRSDKSSCHHRDVLADTGVLDLKEIQFPGRLPNLQTPGHDSNPGEHIFCHRNSAVRLRDTWVAF